MAIPVVRGADPIDAAHREDDRVQADGRGQGVPEGRRAYALLRLQAEGGVIDPGEGHSVRDLQDAAKRLRDARRGGTRARVPATGLKRADALRRWLRRRGLMRSRVRAVIVGAAVWQRVLLPDAEAAALMAG